jgi:hypothetical protein
MSEQRFGPQDWITSAEAATLTGYSRDTFIKATRRGNMFFYRREEIIEYVSKMRELGTRKHTPKIYLDSQPPQTAQ